MFDICNVLSLPSRPPLFHGASAAYISSLLININTFLSLLSLLSMGSTVNFKFSPLWQFFSILKRNDVQGSWQGVANGVQIVIKGYRTNVLECILGERKSIQTNQPASPASTEGCCPNTIQITCSRIPKHWKLSCTIARSKHPSSK